MVSTSDFRLLFESSPGLELVLDPDLTIVAVTNAYLAATMTRREAIMGRNIFDVFPDNPHDPESTGFQNLQASLARVQTLGKSDTMAVQRYDIPRPQGGFEIRYWSPSNHPIYDDQGKLRYIIHRVEEVTEYVRVKEAQAEQGRIYQSLQTRTQQMEADILQASKELETTNEELRQALRFRDEFLSIVSHELRTPLTSLSMKLQILHRHQERGTLTPDLIARYIPNGIKQTDRLGRLLHNLLDVTRILARPLDLEPTDTELTELVAQSIEQFGDLAEQAQAPIRLHTDGEIRGSWDRNRLEQVVDNLLSNAIKYGRGRPIDVYLDRRGGGVSLRVQDRGIGIPAEKTEAIFHRFERAVAKEDYSSGIGLGLYIVQHIVDRHGGRIEVESVEGEGTTFDIWLPHALEESMPSALPDDHARPAH